MQGESLGVDIGGVIIERENGNNDTSFFSKNYLWSRAVSGAFSALRKLALARFPGKVHLVSKCGPAIEKKTLAWLKHYHFHEFTGIPRDRVHFCRERGQKAEVCDRLGITHFIDDRLEVLSHLIGKRRKLYLFQPWPPEVGRYLVFLKQVRIVRSWEEILADLLLKKMAVHA